MQCCNTTPSSSVAGGRPGCILTYLGTSTRATWSSGLSEATQKVLIEALLPVLVRRLKHFLYDMAARSVVKIGKPVRFSPELEIPFGAPHLFLLVLLEHVY
ncbi:hypothetical protein EI94DRAFT_1810253 [Lactarius quietus]|nr:hypothetical protein EI94DRAFT_1810253 [Lactarius quietus]